MNKKPRYHNIKNVLADTDFSQAYLAKEMGMAPTYFSDIVRSKKTATLKFIYELSLLIGKEPAELLLSSKDYKEWKDNLKENEK